MAYPYTYDFNYYVGDSYQFVIRPKVYNEDTEELEEVNLSLYNSLFVVATERGNSQSIIFSASPQISASPYSMLCTISPENGLMLSGASYIYDVEITNKTNNADRTTLLTGTILTQLDISR